jgi:hypothetical protein
MENGNTYRCKLGNNYMVPGRMVNVDSIAGYLLQAIPSVNILTAIFYPGILLFLCNRKLHPIA